MKVFDHIHFLCFILKIEKLEKKLQIDGTLQCSKFSSVEKLNFIFWMNTFFGEIFQKSDTIFLHFYSDTEIPLEIDEFLDCFTSFHIEDEFENGIEKYRMVS